MKTGESFKKGDIVACNNDFFKQTSNSETVFKAGTLAKIALAQGFYTYEDSSRVTKKLCDAMTTTVIKKKELVLGKNSNIEQIVKVGDEVEVGDPLCTFDMSYGDEGINKMLAGMNPDMAKQVANLGKKPVKSKYSGEIVDIKVYYTAELESMSPSLQKTIKEINKPINNIKKAVNKHIDINKTDMILQPTEKIVTKDGKVKGTTVGEEGIMIEFYIAEKDTVKIGDKISFFCALKSVVCDVIPDGQEPFSEYRPDEEVSAFLSPSSVLKRMTGSVLIQMFANKVLIELKRQCKEIYEGKR